MLGRRKSPDHAETLTRRAPTVVDATATLTRESQLYQLSRTALRAKSSFRFPLTAAFSKTHSLMRGAAPSSSLIFDSSDAVAFQQTARSVEQVGAQALLKADQKAYQAKRYAELGVAAPKLKVPAHIAIGMHAKQQERDQKKRELDTAAGNRVDKKPRSAHHGSSAGGAAAVLTPFLSESAQLRAAQSKSVRRHETRVSRNGALIVSRSDLREVARSGKQKPTSLARHFRQ